VLETIAIYFILFTLWVEPTFGIKLSNVKGLSLGNLAFFAACVTWTISFALKKVNFQINKIYISVLLLIFYVVLSIPYKYLIGDFKHFSIMREVVDFKNWLEPFLYFFLLFNLAHNKIIIKRSIFGLMVVCMLTVIITLLDVSNFYIVGRVQIEHGGYWPVFAEPNQYAAYLVLMFPLFLSFTLYCNNKLGRIIFAIFSISILSALIASGSRGGLLSLLASLLIFSWTIKGLKEKAKKNIIVAGGIIILLFSISLFALPSWIENRTTERIEYQDGMDLNDYSSGRFEIWKEHIDYFYRRPILGLGFNGSYNLLEKNAVSHISHNTYLFYLVDYGILGLLIFLIFIMSMLKGSTEGLRKSNDIFGIALLSGFLSGLMGYMLSIFFVNIFGLWSLILIYCAFSLKYAQIEKSEREMIHASFQST
jgi:O-antigen ligase